MASIIRGGGESPLQADSWLNCLKIYLLEQIMDGANFGILKWTLWRGLENHLDLDSIFKKWEHNISQTDLESALKDLQQKGWIKVSEYGDNRLVITDGGRGRVPEHIFP